MSITRKKGENKPLAMIRYLLSPSSRFLLILTCCLGLSTNQVIAATPKPQPIQQTVLNPGMKGLEIQVLQMQLKALGFYQGVIDGDYGETTQKAVAKFQTTKGLNRKDGIADLTTQYFLNQVIAGNSNLKVYPSPTPKVEVNKNIDTQPQPENQQTSFMWWTFLGLGILTATGGVFVILKKFNRIPEKLPQLVEAKLLNPSPENQEKLLLKSAEVSSQQFPTDLVQLDTKPIIAQLNTCEELMQELQSRNSKKRRKAIWKLGQDGDSRAVKPLLDLMIDTDSEQRSLILGTLSEIGTRTLNPINRALIISMRDENPQVRKNAMRDLVRIYDMMGKTSKIILHAMEDPDPEVQETAKYALNQMNRIRTIPDQQMLTDMSREES
ncbi:MAG: peptidoglycan-binding protein [Nostocales cyanobacterium]|nr:MAG: peptidoglycan-binding protein [Nostocales cyanobacterium]TAF10445.1 MAG: peptidoglycan-binding protein [Nostocales cyanobacterium]